MKKFSAALAALLLISGLSACGTRTPPPFSSSAAEPLRLETLRLELARRDGTPADTLVSAVGLLPEALKAALANQGVEVNTVEVTVGASPAATAQALEEGGVDLAALSGAAFVEAEGDAVPLLTAAEQTALPDSADPADWRGASAGWSESPSGGRRYLILAGPSDYGRQLANRAESGTALTWEELDRAAWALSQDGKSMASVWLADNYGGNTLSDLGSVSCDSSSDEGGYFSLAALALGNADVAVIPADVRLDQASLWQGELKRPGGIFEETAVLGVTEKYYGTVLAARSGEALFTEEQFRSALAAALTEVCSGRDDMAAALGGVLSAPISGGDLDAMRRLATLGG